jgi:RNA polymerase sigma-70 factor (ECF subfamily)
MRDTTLELRDGLESCAEDRGAALAMDEERFRAFYDRTASPLLGYLSRLTGDRHAADDLLQETYYRFLRTASLPEDDDHRRHYLFRIATNLVRDGRRRQRTRPPMAATAVRDDAVAVASDAGERAARRADLARAMARLSVRERAMLWLAYAHGSSHREIAAVLGVKPASMKPMLHRARRKLANLIAMRVTRPTENR